MRRRSRLLAIPAGPAIAGIASAALMLASVFLPWYAANLGPPASSGTASGWDATAIAKGVLGLGVIWLLMSALLLADHVDVYRVDARTAEALGWLIAGCALLAGALVAYRLFRPPEPADFLSRDIGLFLALAAAAAGVSAGLAQASRR
jgi:hypothetical protein